MTPSVFPPHRPGERTGSVRGDMACPVSHGTFDGTVEVRSVSQRTWQY